MKLPKKEICLILTGMLLFCLLPLGVFAQEEGIRGIAFVNYETLRLREEKALVHMNGGVRIDLQNPLSHHIDLIFSKAGMGRNNLTVYIRNTNCVIINYINILDSTSYQGFNNITTNASNAKYCNVGLV